MASPITKTFTGEQVARYRRIFDLFDVNKDGKIGARELMTMSVVLGYNFTKMQVLAILRRFDLDANGSLTFDEFLAAMPGAGGTEEQRQVEIKQKFIEFDQDANGFISQEEAYSVLEKELGYSPEKTNMLMSQFDINRDGKLSYEEFNHFYRKVLTKKLSVERAFRQFDTEGKGYITIHDTRKILQSYGFSDPEIIALVRAHDTNQDGRLQYAEFVKMWSG